MAKKKLDKAIKNLDEMLDSGVEWSNQKLKKAHINLRKWLKELREYRKLEKQGRLLRLPCVAGDSVYMVDRHEIYGELEVNKRVISSILINEGKPPLFKAEGVCGRVRLEAFGRTVFLTRQEAEEALERMKGEKA